MLVDANKNVLKVGDRIVRRTDWDNGGVGKPAVITGFSYNGANQDTAITADWEHPLDDCTRCSDD